MIILVTFHNPFGDRTMSMMGTSRSSNISSFDEKPSKVDDVSKGVSVGGVFNLDVLSESQKHAFGKMIEGRIAILTRQNERRSKRLAEADSQIRQLRALLR